MQHEDIYLEIDKAIESKSDIIFLTYSMLDDTDDKIRYTLHKILKEYNKEEWLTPVFSAVKELVSNALKANVKKILIDEGIIKESDSLNEQVKKLRMILNERAILEYGIKVKENLLSTRIYFKLYSDRLVVKIINNLPLRDTELKRIQERILISSKYDSIAEFFMDYHESDAEGMGLGLCMVLSLLKNIYIDCDNFTFTTDGVEKTCAQINIPL